MPESDVRAGREGDVLAAVSQSGPTITFFDTVTDDALGTIELLAEPHELCFDPIQRLLWCTNTYYGGYYHDNDGQRSEVTVIDPDARRVIEIIDLWPEHGPHGLALDADARRLYVSVEGDAERSGGVVVVDTDSRMPLGRIDTLAPGPHWFVIDTARQRGYAANKEAPFVSIVDLMNGDLIATADVPGSEGLAVSQDGAELYIAAPYAVMKPGANSGEHPPGIRVLDTSTTCITEIWPTENQVIPVHLTSSGILLAGQPRMVADGSTGLGSQRSGRLTAFSTKSRAEVATVLLTGELPLTITSSPDGRLGYVASVASSTIDVVDLHTWQLITALSVPKRAEPGAHGLAYIPRPVS